MGYNGSCSIDALIQMLQSLPIDNDRPNMIHGFCI